MTTPNPVSPSLAQKGEEERVAFEKAHDKLFGYQYDSSLAYERRTVDEHLYRYADVQRDWEVWQAARTTPDHRDERIRELSEQVRQHQSLLVNLEDTCRVHLALPHNSIPDCTDNSGNPYPSQWATDLFKAARATLSNSLPTEEDK
jgi:hypothetical protein